MIDNDINSVDTQDGWIRFNYDTGAAVSVYPEDMISPEVRRGLATNGRSYRSACGKIVPDLGGVRIVGEAEDGYQRALKARIAKVSKPLISASSTTGHLTAWIAKKGEQSFLIPASGKVTGKIQQILNAEAKKKSSYLMALYEEDGTYNFWLNTRKGDISGLTLSEEAKKLSREELEQAYAKGPHGPSEE